MTTHQHSLNECSTPWWYETPSLVSQSTFSSNTYCTGTSQIDPFDITPSQSSGYYDDDTTASEGSSNLFTGVPGSCATGSELTDNSTLCTLSAIKSAGSNPGHRQLLGASGSAEGAGEACFCEHCTGHGATYVRHGLVRKYEALTQATEQSNSSKVMIAPVSPTALVSSFNSMEMFNTPSTCTELNELADSQDSLSEQKKYSSGEYCGSSPFSDDDERGSQLSHSMACTNQQILRELARDLMQHIDSTKLFTCLQHNRLLTSDDVEYICNPKRTESERKRRIIISAPCHDPDAFDRFVDCLSMEHSHPGHAFLAKRMREAIKKKRENPFRTMSSLRKKRGTSTRHHSESDAHSVRKHYNDAQVQPSFPAQSSPKHHHGDAAHVHVPSKSDSLSLQTSSSAHQRSPASSVRHSLSSNTSVDASSAASEIPNSRATLPNTTAYSNATAGQLHLIRRSPNTSCGSTGYAYTPSTHDQDATLSDEEFYDSFKRDHFESCHQLGGYSSLPRQISYSGVNLLNRCSPAYSSARYQAEQKQKAISLNRSGSFHTHRDMSPAHLVSPLTRGIDPNSSSIPPYHKPNCHDCSYHRKYSLPVTSQHGPPFGTTPKSHSGSQLSNAHSSLYPPLQEDNVSNGLSSVQTYTQGDYLLHDETVKEHGFPVSFPQLEGQSATDPHSQYESVGNRNNEPLLPSLSDNTKRYQSLLTEIDNYGNQHPSLPSDQYFQSVTEIEGSMDELSLHRSAERMHRRSHSCDASKVQQEGLVLSAQEVKSRHYSLTRRQPQPSYEEMKSRRIAGKETGDSKLSKRKILWLQERVQFTDFFEELNFLSLTHYYQPRNILYSGTLYEHGKPKFVVLLTDMLLILKPKKKNVVQSKFGVQLPQLDWFSDLGCKAKRPLFLHLMMVQKKLKKQSSDSFCICYNNLSEMVEITFQAVSKEAKDVWVESLSRSIKTCTEDNASSILPVGSPAICNRLSGQPYTKLHLTVSQANNLALSCSNCKTRSHYCSVHFGEYRCRTPSVKAKCWPSWNFQLVFSNFSVTETVHVGFFAERSTCPDDFLGNVAIDLTTLLQSHKQRVQRLIKQMNKLLFRNQVYPLMNGKGTLTFDIELDWETKMY